MMMDPDRFADALYATPPLEAVKGMLCADFDGHILPFDSAVARTCTGPERLVAVRRPLRNTGTSCPFTALYGAPVRDNPFQSAEN